MADERPKPPYITVGAARLRGDEEAETSLQQAPLQAPKDELLWSTVMSEPWDTGLGWVDARANNPDADPEELDRIMTSAILELHDEGLARFFVFENFGEEYSRTPSDDEYLTREELEGAISDGSRSLDTGYVSAPALGIRATERGCERVFELWPEDRARWENYPSRRRSD